MRGEIKLTSFFCNMTILYILIGLIVGCCGLYLILRPKLKITQQQNTSIAKENKELEIQNFNLKEVYNKYQSDINILNIQKETLKDNLSDLKETQAKAAKDFYDQALSIAETSYEQELDRISEDLCDKREEAKQFYLKTIEEGLQAYKDAVEEKEKEFSYWNGRIIALQADVQTALEAAKRKVEMETQQDYYRICLSDEDVAEIKRLREVLPYLRDKTPLNKVIYKVYYEKPLTDMIGRVVGPEPRTGIYKITNINNEMCYVGQAANIADRWKQHVKRGVGAEDWTQNKLYPAMYALGVENFTFEVVEECDRSELNQREDYWQLYFHAKDFGYSIK